MNDDYDGDDDGRDKPDRNSCRRRPARRAVPLQVRRVTVAVGNSEIGESREAVLTPSVVGVATVIITIILITVIS